MPEPELRKILEQSRTIAVLGAHPEPTRAAHYVPAYLQQQGYRIVPVNPHYLDRRLFGQPVRATLAELSEPIDMIDVFRRSQALPEHVDDILRMNPRPKVVWFQLGIVNDTVARRLESEGIVVVQNRCTLAEHRRLGIGAVS